MSKYDMRKLIAKIKRLEAKLSDAEEAIDQVILITEYNGLPNIQYMFCWEYREKHPKDSNE